MEGDATRREMTEKPAWRKGFLRKTSDEIGRKTTPYSTLGPSLVTTDSPIVKAILRASEVMLGKPAETYYSPSAFDQGYLNHVGIVTANFGAGEHQYAHTDYDMASVERTADAAKVYAFMMLDYLT
jgi:acetylornithine deacetylase/succinyl-diaminopimelate desuccinylase-like protein